MIIKPRSLTSLSGRPECEGLVYAACPGIDLPYEMFSKQKFTKAQTPNMAGASPYGYCYNSTGTQDAISTPQCAKLKSITDKCTIITIQRPANFVTQKFLFAFANKATWSSPFADIGVTRESVNGAPSVWFSTSPTTFQNQTFTAAKNYLEVGKLTTLGITRNGAALNAWKNGAWQETLTLASANPISWGTGLSVIGNRLPNLNPCWDGDITAIYIWNRVLSHSEISLISAFPFILFDSGELQFDYGAYFGVPPGAPTLDSPANGATGVALPPTFEWTAAA